MKKLIELSKEIQKCQRCHLCELKMNVYDLEKGYGKLPGKFNGSDIMFVGMNPSYRRFPGLQYAFGGGKEHGGTGDEFTDLLKETTLWKRCHLTNLMKCSTEDNKVHDFQIKHCLKWLEKEIEIIKPKLIVPMGKDAIKYFDAVLGKLAVNLKYKCATLGIYHPNYVISYKRDSMDNFRKQLEMALQFVLYKDFPKLIIFFEGVDKSGKTAIKKEFTRLTNECCYTVDRFVISNIVYDEYFERADYQTIKFYSKVIKMLFLPDEITSLVVYCYADEETILKRVKKHKEEEFDFKKQMLMFEATIKGLNLPCISINTSKTKSPAHAAYLLIDQIEKDLK
jgi:uracil-DNA glycosylase family 4